MLREEMFWRAAVLCRREFTIADTARIMYDSKEPRTK